MKTKTFFISIAIMLIIISLLYSKLNKILEKFLHPKSAKAVEIQEECSQVVYQETTNPAPNDFQNKQIYKVTAYCPCKKCCGEYADGVTASGYIIQKGDKFCASPLPFGTILNIPGYGVVPVRDRGGAIKENSIDVYFDTHQEALNWGVQYLRIEVVGENK